MKTYREILDRLELECKKIKLRYLYRGFLISTEFYCIATEPKTLYFYQATLVISPYFSLSTLRIFVYAHNNFR